MHDFLPDGDGELRAWSANFVSFVQANRAAVGLSDDEVTALASGVAGFEAELTGQEAAEAAARAATRRKNSQRQSLKESLRAIVRQIQAAQMIDDAQRQAMGISLRGGGRSLAVAPSTRPVGMIWASQSLRHELRLFDEMTPTRRARPRGVLGAEIWVKVVPTGSAGPASDADWSFVQLATASPCAVEFAAADAGKNAWYRLRWINSRAQRGPWSEPVIATIAG